MANLIDHIAQADHNRVCAEKFLNDCQCRDWAITATFYSALHFVEAGFEGTPVGHSVRICPNDETEHGFRTKLVRQEYGKTCWRSYRKLSSAAWHVRYLAKSRTAGIAAGYYSEQNARDLLDIHLVRVRNEAERASGTPLT